MATTAAMRPPTTAATLPHIMDMDMADHTTDIGGLIIVDIARLTIVRTTVRVSTGGGAAGRNQKRTAGITICYRGVSEQGRIARLSF
jgi:hypothetical protein